MMTNKKVSYTKVLENCIEIAEERQLQYGEASDNLQEAVDILYKVFDISLSVQTLCKVMVALKLSREKHQHKDDNVLDIINYLAISLNSK